MVSYIIYALDIAVVCGAFYLLRRFTRPTVPYAPGPKKQFILGNVRDFPVLNIWETFASWRSKYGDLIDLDILGQHVVVINSTKVAEDLLENRQQYSDRPDFPMLNDLMGSGWNFGTMHYGENWRIHRKIFHQGFNPNSLESYKENEIKHVRMLLDNLYHEPDRFMKHIAQMACALVMDITYGIQVLPENDPFYKIADDALKVIVSAGVPGKFLVDVFPLLKYVPAWMPGAGFQRQALEWRKPIMAMVEKPFGVSKRQYDNGSAPHCFVSSLLDQLVDEKDWAYAANMEKVIANVGGSAYMGGFETTLSTIQNFFLAMVISPSVQEKAHEELDRVIGPHRLPDFTDRNHLPYIEAICKEVLRWCPAAPLGSPHRLTQDDIYNGMLVPKGSIVLTNIWAMMRNEEEYGPDFEDFRPERHLEQKVLNPMDSAFGFGRRICPGKPLAENILFITAASVLHAFKLEPARDATGAIVPVKGQFESTGLTLHPAPFKCSISPRSKLSKQLLSEIRDNI